MTCAGAAAAPGVAEPAATAGDRKRSERRERPERREAAAWAVLDTVPDPEVPALSLRDLGVVRRLPESIFQRVAALAGR